MLGPLVDERVEREGADDGSGHDDDGIFLGNAHQFRDVIHDAGLEEAHTGSFKELSQCDDSKMPVGKGVLQGAQKRRGGTYGSHVVGFTDDHGRQKQKNRPDDRENQECHSPCHDGRKPETFHEGDNGRRGVTEHAAHDEEQGMERITVHQHSLVLDHFREQRPVGNHVQGVENIVSPDKDGQPDVVKGRVGGRRPENEERADGEWHGEYPHEGDSPTVLERAFITQTGHERVGNGVNDVADSLDEPDDGEDSRKHVALCNQGGKSGFFRRLVKINQVVVQHGGEQSDCEHGQAVDDDGTLRHFFHGFSPRLHCR